MCFSTIYIRKHQPTSLHRSFYGRKPYFTLPITKKGCRNGDFNEGIYFSGTYGKLLAFAPAIRPQDATIPFFHRVATLRTPSQPICTQWIWYICKKEWIPKNLVGCLLVDTSPLDAATNCSAVYGLI